MFSMVKQWNSVHTRPLMMMMIMMGKMMMMAMTIGIVIVMRMMMKYGILSSLSESSKKIIQTISNDVHNYD